MDNEMDIDWLKFDPPIGVTHKKTLRNHRKHNVVPAKKCCSYKQHCSCTFCFRRKKKSTSYQQIAWRLHGTTVEMILENVSASYADFAGASDNFTNLPKKRELEPGIEIGRTDSVIFYY